MFSRSDVVRQVRSMKDLGFMARPKAGSELEEIQEPISGAYVEFAQKVRAITGNVPRTTAAIRAGISHDSIARMWRGERVSEPLIIRFAIGYKVPANPLLKLAGYPTVPGMDRALDTGINEIERQFDPSDLPVVYSYSGLKEPNKKAVEALIKQFEAAEKAESIGGKIAD